MATFEIVDWSRNRVGDIELADDVFATAVKPDLHWELVRWQRAKKRAGTHFTKNRHEMRGTGKKPFRQKGTGRARQGDVRSPLLRGGAVVHGPRPRSYYYPLPRKVRSGGLRSALSMLARDKRLVVVKDFDGVGPKSREVLDRLVGIGADRALLVDDRNESLRRGVRNLREHKYVSAEGINVLDLLDFGMLVISETAAREIEGRLSTGERSGA